MKAKVLKAAILTLVMTLSFGLLMPGCASSDGDSNDSGGDSDGGGGGGCNYSDLSNLSGSWTFQGTSGNNEETTLSATIQASANGSVSIVHDNYCNTTYTGTIYNSHLDISSDNEHWMVTNDGNTTHCCTGTGQVQGTVVTCTEIDLTGTTIDCFTGASHSLTGKATKP